MSNATLELATEKANLIQANKEPLKLAEKAIERSQTAFFDAAKAVVQIVENELFAGAYKNKTAYFEDRWGFDKSDVNRYENAGRVLITLKTAGFEGKTLPKNEGQCREIHRRSKIADLFSPARAVDLWKAITEAKGPVTAKSIGEAAEKLWPIQGVAATAGDLGPAVLSIAQETASEITEQTVRATLIIKTAGQEGFGSSYNFDEQDFRTVRDGEHELTIEGKTRRQVMAELAEWAALDVCTEVTVRFG